jgi:hypothetical protein
MFNDLSNGFFVVFFGVLFVENAVLLIAKSYTSKKVARIGTKIRVINSLRGVSTGNIPS